MFYFLNCNKNQFLIILMSCYTRPGGVEVDIDFGYIRIRRTTRLLDRSRSWARTYLGTIKLFPNDSQKAIMNYVFLIADGS